MRETLKEPKWNQSQSFPHNTFTSRDRPCACFLHGCYLMAL